MTKQPRRSIVSSFSALAAPMPASTDAVGASDGEAGFAPEQKSGFTVPRISGNPVPRVGAGVIGATQRTMTDIREERDRLLAQVEAGGWLEIDPALIDPSPFPDRLPDDDAVGFSALRQTMAEEGQKVPVELRRHPDQNGRFQIVYGHRRWRAALELGIRVKAFVTDLNDRDMVIAQGIENAARQDLSWIEKALFAHQMDLAGIKARDIRAALVVDDPEIARFRSVCRTLGVDVIRLIGRAPRAGRPRWGELVAGVLSNPRLLARISQTLAAAKDLPSDARFTACLALLSEPAGKPRQQVPLKAVNGKAFGAVVFSPDGFRLRIEKSRADAFIAFFEEELPALAERFLARERNP
jgi:ParB family transcriptional regulator, chromosome partitioning protein